MKAGIFDPYLSTLGGGERYCFTLAETLIKQGWQVDIFWSGNKKIITKAIERFSLDIDKINIKKDIFNLSPQNIDLLEEKDINKISCHQCNNLHNKLKAFIKKFYITSQYDLFFYISDGSIPFLFSKNNLIHYQVPFTLKQNKFQKISTLIKEIFINKFVCNSKFTEKFINKYVSNKTLVLYPPVDINKFNTTKDKKNIILSVGRFDNIMNNKKQDILIEAFSKVHAQNKNWQLVLAGGSLKNPKENKFLQYLITKTNNLPVDFVVNPDFDTLKKIYTKAKIYWHAAGFDINENQKPEFTEHFGITVVEAMASGVVPLVINKGGLPEIILDKKSGYIWGNLNELITLTQKLIDNPKKLNKISRKSINRSKLFSKENFNKILLKKII